MATLTTNIPVSTDLYTIDATSYDAFALTFVDGQVNRAQFPNVSVTFDFATISLPADLSQWVTVTITQPATGRVAVKWAGNVRVDPGVSISTAASTATTVYAFTSTGRDWTVFPSSISGVASDLSSQYAPLTGDVRWIAANTMVAVSGSPTLSAVNRRPVWLLDGGTAVELIGSTLTIPGGWQTFHVDVWWVNAGAGSGDVRLRLDSASDGDGDTLGSNPTSGTTVTDTAGAQNVVVTTRVGSSLAVVADEAYVLNLVRLPNDALDTLANDIGVLGLRLIRAS